MRSLLFGCFIATLLIDVSAKHGKAAAALRRHARLPTITCPDGQYFNKSGCEPCVQNYMCAFSQMYPCPDGTTSYAGASECTEHGPYDASSAHADGAHHLPWMHTSSQQDDAEEDEDGDYADDGEEDWTAHQALGHRMDVCFELGEMQCPSPDGTGQLCADPMTNLESCGGCSIPDEFGYAGGTDCTALDGALDVSCVKGNCLISSCRDGFGVVHTSKGMQCVKDYDRLLSGERQRVVQVPMQ